MSIFSCHEWFDTYFFFDRIWIVIQHFFISDFMTFARNMLMQYKSKKCLSSWQIKNKAPRGMCMYAKFIARMLVIYVLVYSACKQFGNCLKTALLYMCMFIFNVLLTITFCIHCFIIYNHFYNVVLVFALSINTY